jgi:CCR4-NOT transcription complex subunit 7/8
MGRCPGLRGGLDAVAAALGAQREAGRAHQAGSDSALTWEAFRRVRQVYFAKEGVRGFAGVLFGLELELDLAAAAVNGNKHGGVGAINNNKVGNIKLVNNGGTNKFANNGGGRCAVGGNGGRNRSRNSRRVAPQVQVAVAALR